MPPKLNLNLPVLEQSTLKKNGFLTGTMEDLCLFTALQPIFSLAHKRVVGYEALVRARDKHSNAIPPSRLFAQTGLPGRVSALTGCADIFTCTTFSTLTMISAGFF